MTAHAAYWDELARLLRTRGLPPEHAAATVAELGAHHGGPGPADPAGAFGPAAELARRLAPGQATADERFESWRWSADTYADQALLDRFGDDGWEVEDIDALGRFVSRRNPERPRYWEYRRDVVPGDRGARDAELAHDGWEPCGTWVVYAWYKRPKAPPPAPAEPVRERKRRPWWSRRR
ncbi:hypothetical protein [Streptomyces longispororuber]|uniref:hypothetical protein n=1 Tax=Streptomyces longispororuber TaxID=68230 RepID=UPI00210B0CF7|nr:hypothetical protein [Streptomyces longispororuber]MCQ4208805.1 hypothetical protein [Streptomyces longispororuber]